MEKKQQTIMWYDYWWRPRPIRNVTIKNVTVDEDGHAEGEYHDEHECVMHVSATSLTTNTWKLI
jgi:hypothetical protein